MRYSYTLQAGSPSPLGATVQEKGVNFALCAPNAEWVLLCLCDAKGKEIERIPVRSRTGDVWHVFLQGAKEGLRYGYRVYGPFDPEQGHRFNPNKFLLDPLAKQLTGPIFYHPAQLGYDPTSEEKDLSFSDIDSAPFVPKGIVVDTRPLLKQPSNRTLQPFWRKIIYEAHVKGFTIKNKELNSNIKGTIKAISSPVIQSYLKDLGISALELLPIAAFAGNNPEKGKTRPNYWGYDPICFSAIHAPYLSGNKISELRELADTLHKNGASLILDVVFNHTGEGNELGPTLSLKGIDNKAYYRLIDNNKRYYVNDSGCGNTLDLSSQATLSVVLEALRHYVQAFDVDAFRFDLASILGRDYDNVFSKESMFFRLLEDDSKLKNTQWIAEPWDVGMGGYQLGNFPSNWIQWTDTFRDTARAFWKGDEGKALPLMSEMAGLDIPYQRVNFVTAHDGFSLYDLVSYNMRHNEANGENNKDGAAENLSWNSGVEGPTTNQKILKLRFRRAKALMASLLLSNGVPMIRSGDEVLATQQGNNNAYCQDNDIAWFDWSFSQPFAQQMRQFIKQVISLRKTYQFFSHVRGLTFNSPALLHFAQPFRPDGKPMQPDDWQDFVRAFGLLLNDTERRCHHAIFCNASATDLTYNVPPLQTKRATWKLLLDTSATLKNITGTKISVPAWSIVIVTTATEKNNAHV